MGSPEVESSSETSAKTASSIAKPKGRDKSRPMDDGLRMPTCCIITPDGSTVLAVASYSHEQIVAFDRKASGSLTNMRVWASLPGLRVNSICLDAEGCVWVAV